jgi:photosystem II stability/assembly factor-like uncharacterized protein
MPNINNNNETKQLKLITMKKTILLFVTFISMLSFANAQWQQTSLDSGGVASFAVTGNNIFAATSHGVCRSTDNGTNWYIVNTGLPNTNNIYNSPGVIAASGTNVFVGYSFSIGSLKGGVYLSTNNGASWAAKNTGLPYSNDTYYCIEALAINGSNIFAGTNGQGIYLSTNNGNSWTAVNNGFSPNLKAMSLAINDSNIFSGTYNDGIYLSTNNGTSWSAMNTGLTNSSINSIAFSGTNIFVGSSDDGIFLSTNNGVSWTEADSGITGTNSLGIGALAVNGTDIFAGTGAGVFLSSDTGSSWTDVSSGLPYGSVSPLAIIGSNIFAGTSDRGVWKASLNGLGINEINYNNNILLYPTPAINNIIIEIPQQEIIEISNIQGRLIRSLKVIGNKTSIDVSGFAKGMYFVKVKTENGISVKKFVKE